jgi:hypothetical protein
MKNNFLKEIIQEAFIEVLREQEVLKTSSQEILGKFPTLRKSLETLLTSEFDSFVQDVQWIAPKPTTFKIVLKNKDHFFMKWLGRGFEAQIAGKKYYLGSLPEYQQALDKLNELLRYEPIGVDKEAEDTPEPDIEGGFEETPTEPGGPEIEGGEEVEFEEPVEEPEV